MNRAQCLRCPATIEYDPELVVGNMIPAVCGACLAADTASKQHGIRDAAHRDLWERICPATFLDTDPTQLPMPERSEVAMGWDFSNRGLNLFGKPRLGKTRTLLLVLKRMHFNERRKIKFLGPGDFSAGCEQRPFKTSDWVKMLQKVEILAIDEIDKMSLTRPMEMAFFAVIDCRTACGRPILLTGNSDGTELQTRFKNSPALVARIREFCRSIYFG